MYQDIVDLTTLGYDSSYQEFVNTRRDIPADDSNLYNEMNIRYNAKPYYDIPLVDVPVGSKIPFVSLVTLDNGDTISGLINATKTETGYDVQAKGVLSDIALNIAGDRVLSALGIIPDDYQDQEYQSTKENLLNTWNYYGVDAKNKLVAGYYDVTEKAEKLWDEIVLLNSYDNIYEHFGNIREPGLTLLPTPTDQYIILPPVPFNAHTCAEMVQATIPISRSLAETDYKGSTFYESDTYKLSYITKVIQDGIDFAPELFTGYRSYFSIYVNCTHQRPYLVDKPTYGWGNYIVIDMYDVDYSRFRYFSSDGRVNAYMTSPSKRVIINDIRTTGAEAHHTGSTAYALDIAADRQAYNKWCGFWGIRYTTGTKQVATATGTRTVDHNVFGFSGSYNSTIRPDWLINDYPPSGRGYDLDYPNNRTYIINQHEIDPVIPPNVPQQITRPAPAPPYQRIKEWGYPMPRPEDRTPEGVKEPPSPQSTRGLFTVYYVGDDELNAVKRKLWNPDAISVIKEMFSDNPINSIVDLHAVYVQPVENINYNDYSDVYLYTVDCGDDSSSPVITNNIAELSYGYVDITRKFNDYRDYSPFTSLDLYLPFIGYVNLPVDPFVNGKIGVKYNVDLVTGNCVAFVMSNVNNVVQCVATYDGNCSFQLPIYGVDRRSLGISAVGAAGDILAGRFGSAVSKVITTGQSIQKSGNISGNHGALSYKHPFVIINRCIDADTENYNRLYGYTANNQTTLGGLSGYVRVSECHVDTIGCTQEEQQMIYNLLKNGVIV